MANAITMDGTTESLSHAASGCAMRGAAAYFASVGFTVADYDAACETIKRHIKAALPQALADAREAIEANMGDVAAQTFAASMRLAGIAAAKEIVAGRLPV